MATPASLKQDLEFSRSLSEIVDALKTSALIQFRSFQLKEKPNLNFLKEIEVSFRLFLIHSGDVRHPYLFRRGELPTAVVVVTSDEGFSGDLNALLINAGLDMRKTEEDEIIVLGERGARHLEEIKENFLFFPGISLEAEFGETEAIRSYLFKNYRRRFGQIVIIYPEFISLVIQRITVLQFLPYLTENSVPTSNIKRIEDFLREPSSERVLDGLVWLWMGFKLWEIFWSSKQSEFAARIMHLEGSTQELSQLNQQLVFQYSRQMHALSDKTIREISAAKILLGKK